MIKFIRYLKQKLTKVIRLLKGDMARGKVISSEHRFPTFEQSEKAFLRSKEKLFQINKWSQMPGISSSFQLFSPAGPKENTDKPEIGDFLRIDLPGPFPENWVKVVSLKNQKDLAEFIVLPSEKPTFTGKKEVKHFFTDEASSTFRVKHSGRTIIASETGRKEAVNNQQPEAGNREWINTLIAAGAWLGFQKIQWKNLTDYLVHDTEINGSQNRPDTTTLAE